MSVNQSATRRSESNTPIKFSNSNSMNDKNQDLGMVSDKSIKMKNMSPIDQHVINEEIEMNQNTQENKQKEIIKIKQHVNDQRQAFFEKHDSLQEKYFEDD